MANWKLFSPEARILSPGIAVAEPDPRTRQTPIRRPLQESLERQTTTTTPAIEPADEGEKVS